MHIETSKYIAPGLIRTRFFHPVGVLVLSLTMAQVSYDHTAYVRDTTSQQSWHIFFM